MKNNVMASSFQSLLDDRLSGSTSLLKQLFDLILQNNLEGDLMKEYLEKFKQNFSHFAVIRNCIGTLLGKENYSSDEIISWKERITTSSEKIIINVNQTLGDLTGKKIMTISNSETLKVVLNGIKVKEIFVMQSIPGSEGLQLYEQLESSNSRIISDDRTLAIIKNNEIDYIFSGCDSYQNQNWFVNKIKSFQICEKTNEVGIPYVILTSSLKQTTEPILDKDGLLEVVPWKKNIVLITD